MSSSASKVAQLSELLKSMTAVDLAPRLQRGMPKIPTHPHLIIDPTVTHQRNGYYCQTLSLAEHTGCHVDAPAHAVSYMMDATIDKVPANHLFGEGILYNFSDREWKAGELLTADEILAYERKHQIQAGQGEIALICFGWHSRYWNSPQFYESNEPGIEEDGTILFAERKVRAVGSDTIGCEIPIVNGVLGDLPGHHRHWLPNGILIIEMLAQLEKLPHRSFIFTSPLPIENGSGSPLRPVAYF